MVNTELISGRFCKREDFDEGIYPTDAQVEAYVKGDPDLPHRVKRWLDECMADPDGSKWDEAHEDCIFCSPDWLFGILFAYFPTADSYEKNYRHLKQLVGHHPLDYTNVSIAVSEMYRKQCEAINYEPPHSKRFLELVANNPNWKGK